MSRSHRQPNATLRRDKSRLYKIMKDRLHLTFPRERVASPVMCEIARLFAVEYSIRRANVDAHAGWMDLELTGEDVEIERVIAYLQERGVRVDPIEGDIIAG